MTNSLRHHHANGSSKGFGSSSPKSIEDELTTCVAEALQNSKHPLSLRELVMQAREILPRGINADVAVSQTINQLFQAVLVGPDQYGWLTNLIDGSVIRHPLTAEEARQGFLLLDELEHAVFFPEFFQTHRSSNRILYIELFGGATIPAEAYIERKTWSLRLGPQFVEWVEEQGGQGRDDIIITAVNAAQGQYVVRLQPNEARDDTTIQSRNVQLTLKAEEIVRQEQLVKDSMTTWDLAARLIAQDVYRDRVPADDLHCVLHQYSLLHFDSNVGYTLKEEGVGQINSPSNQTLYAQPTAVEKKPDPKYDVPALTDMDPNMLGPTGSLSADKDDYDSYLDRLFQSGIMDSPITEKEYNVLRAELNSLMELEQQFGYLLTEQRNRQHNLMSCLLIDARSCMDDDTDMSGQSDLDEPPCWEN